MKSIFNLSIVMVILFSSCTQNHGNFEIINNSDFDLDSVTIQPDANKQFVNVPKGTKSTIITNMDEAKTDGSYMISYKNLNTKKYVEHKFGYYTNGNQIEENIKVTIQNDTVIFTVQNDIMIINHN